MLLVHSALGIAPKAPPELDRLAERIPPDVAKALTRERSPFHLMVKELSNRFATADAQTRRRLADLVQRDAFRDLVVLLAKRSVGVLSATEQERLRTLQQRMEQRLPEDVFRPRKVKARA